MIRMYTHTHTHTHTHIALFKYVYTIYTYIIYLALFKDIKGEHLVEGIFWLLLHRFRRFQPIVYFVCVWSLVCH